MLQSFERSHDRALSQWEKLSAGKKSILIITWVLQHTTRKITDLISALNPVLYHSGSDLRAFIGPITEVQVVFKKYQERFTDLQFRGLLPPVVEADIKEGIGHFLYNNQILHQEIIRAVTAQLVGRSQVDVSQLHLAVATVCDWITDPFQLLLPNINDDYHSIRNLVNFCAFDDGIKAFILNVDYTLNLLATFEYESPFVISYTHHFMKVVLTSCDEFNAAAEDQYYSSYRIIGKWSRSEVQVEITNSPNAVTVNEVLKMSNTSNIFEYIIKMPVARSLNIYDLLSFSEKANLFFGKGLDDVIAFINVIGVSSIQDKWNCIDLRIIETPMDLIGYITALLAVNPNDYYRLISILDLYLSTLILLMHHYGSKSRFNSLSDVINAGEFKCFVDKIKDYVKRYQGFCYVNRNSEAERMFREKVLRENAIRPLGNRSQLSSGSSKAPVHTSLEDIRESQRNNTIRQYYSRD